MISKLYEVGCDKCGNVINHYICYKPTFSELRKDGCKVITRNGKTFIYCKTCKTDIK